MSAKSVQAGGRLYNELLTKMYGTNPRAPPLVKMDIEGAEIPLLESLDAATCKPLRKLVFEYTFDVDPSIPRFLAIVRRLKQWFPTVHYTKVNPKDKEYRHYPPCTMVYCVRPREGA